MVTCVAKKKMTMMRAIAKDIFNLEDIGFENVGESLTFA